MLKPSDKWTWFYDDKDGHLMLDLGDDMLFRTNLERKWLVDYAFDTQQFSVDDATAYHHFKEQIMMLPLSEPRQAELALYCTAAKRFHKPVQPKSWFFDVQHYQAPAVDTGTMVNLSNCHNSGVFIVLEAGESASLVAYAGLEEFVLSGSKSLVFGQVIKVMHDRMQLVPMVLYSTANYALVG